MADARRRCHVAEPKTITQGPVTERDYLAALGDACPPAIWREIVARAVEDAKAGDGKAREFLTRYLIGKTEDVKTSLHQLAVDAASGADPVAEAAEHQKRLRKLAGLLWARRWVSVADFGRFRHETRLFSRFSRAVSAFCSPLGNRTRTGQ